MDSNAMKKKKKKRTAEQKLFQPSKIKIIIIIISRTALYDIELYLKKYCHKNSIESRDSLCFMIKSLQPLPVCVGGRIIHK